MSLTNSNDLRNEIHRLVRNYVDDIKIQSKANLNSEAVIAEGFFRNYLNLLYGFNLSKEKIESITNDTIDLHDTENEICVQVTARNTKTKFNETINGFIKNKKSELYKSLIILILDRNVSYKILGSELSEYGVAIKILDYSKLYNRLQTHFDSYDLVKPVYNFVISDLNPNFIESDYLESSLSHKTPDFFEVPVEFEKLNIVDKLYFSLNEFKGLNCIHPEIIVNLPPFKNDKSSTSSYSNFCLKTDNKEIHDFLQKIKVVNYKIEIIDASIENDKEKIQAIFEYLNHSLIQCICYREKYTEIEHHKIKVVKNDKLCDCNYCLFNRYEIGQLTARLKSKNIEHSIDLKDAISEGYFLCKLGYHIKGWSVFESIRNKAIISDQSIYSFLAQLNIRSIRGFINAPWNSDEREVISKKIESIDIYPRILSYPVSKNVRNEIIRIKEDYYLNIGRRKVYKLFENINKTKNLYEGGGTTMGPNYLSQLYNELLILYCFYVANHIIIDDFDDFKSIFSKGIDGFFTSYSTKKSYQSKLSSFNSQIFNWIIHYLDIKKLEEIITKNKITEIEISEDSKNEIIATSLNFLKFQYDIGPFSSYSFNSDLSKQEYFSLFRQNIRSYYDKIMYVLSLSNFQHSDLNEISSHLVNFIKSSEDFNSINWKYTALYIDKYTSSFKESQIKEILLLTLNSKNHRSGEDEIESICYSVSNNTDYSIDESFLLNFIDKLTEPCSNCGRVHKQEILLSPWLISPKNIKEKIKNKVVEILEEKFDPDLYQEAVFSDVITKDEGDLANYFVEYTIKVLNKNDLINEKGENRIRSFRGYNCINCLEKLKLDLSPTQIKTISETSDYYKWLISPKEFSYKDFNVNWLLNACPSLIKSKLKGIGELEKLIKEKLASNYNDKLSKFYFKYILTE